MLQANKYITRFDRTLWATLALFTALLITFALYMYSEVNINRAHQQLVHSRELSDELRQSSDDLTRMARTYVVTHDPIYKKYYQEIIDIRDGLVPRPLNYNNIYWDLVLADNKRPRPTQPPVAFMNLITKAGFTNQELAKLSEAKQYSDTLALSEYAAMYLADANNDDAAINRHKALEMLYDTSYHHAKYQIMKALSDFNTLSEKRTNDSLQSAKTKAFILRIVFILLSILFVFSLLRIFFLLKKILGGSLSQIYEHLFRLGNGDFTTVIDMQNVSQSSILNWILQTQQKLKKIDTMRATSEEKARRISNLYAALSQCNQAIVRCTTKEELFTQTCHDIVTFGEMKMVWIGMYDESNKSLHPVAYAGNGTDYLEGLKISVEASSVFGRGPTGTAFREDRPFWCQDFQNDPATEPWHKRGEEFGWRASASLPLHLNGTVVGVFTVYSTHENAFDEEAQRLLTEMCSDISFALNGFEHEALRVNTQLELSSAYNLLSTIINTAPMRIFWKDLDLNYLGCNDVFAKDAGKETHEDVIGKDDYQMGWKEQAELYRADDRKVIESGIPKIFFDEPQTTPTGEKIWLSTSKVPLYDPDNNIMGVLGMYQDITQRKNAESALIESESRLQAIIQTEPECVKTVDSRCRLTQMNPAGLAMLEAQTLEEAQNHSLTDFLLPEYRAAFIDMHHRVMNGENRTLEFEVIGLKGTRRWLETHATPMRDAEGKIINLLGVTRDITQRKENESDLLLQTQAMEQSPNSIIITDFKANIEYVNAAFVNSSGYTSSEVIGKNPRFLKSGNTPEHAYDSMWAALVRQEKWQGEFINKRKDGTNYIYSINVAPVINKEGRTTHYIAIEEDISEQKKTQERIHYLANFDALTGLPNRIQMDEHLRYTLSLAKRNPATFALMFLDLDHFKNINDTLGHSIGDLLLVELAKRLSSAVRDEDTVSRMGGDEFVLLLPETDENGAGQVAQKLLQSIAQPFVLEGHELTITGSIGIALYPSDGSDIETLSKNADAAMYRSKRDGRNAYCFFTQQMQTNSQRNLELSNALHTALQRNEFHLVYQPQHSMEDNSIIGAEALIRWNHPSMGSISPMEFIPVAEDNGMILAIGEWVLRTAVQQAYEWNQNNNHSILMAVNLSAVQFRHPSLVTMITEILDDIDLPPQYLEIELTEGVAMHNPKAAVNVMNSLHDIGVRMSIDDFGTGYSSLSYLKKFNIYKLKIDQSFVRDISTDPEDKAIVSAVIQMARSLGLKTIAEGVETIEQLNYLKEQQCDEIQGYYYSKPLLPEEFEAYINTYQKEK